MKYKNFSVASLLICFIFMFGCNKNNEHLISGNAFGSIYHVIFNNINKHDPSAIKSNIDYIIKSIDITASNYNSNSEISVYNNQNVSSYKLISSNLYKIISKAKKASKMTNGFFDITIGDIKIKKGFYVNSKKITSRNGRAFTINDIILHKDSTSLKKNYEYINIDLSGIAKGYTVDLIYNYLQSLNISKFSINIGGEVKVFSNDSFHRIFIDDPSGDLQYIEEVFLKNKSIATSGTYIDTINYKGSEISHIINPKTLENVTNTKLLVSVIHRECAIADALATGLIAMNHKDIIDFSNTNNIASMLILFDNNKTEKYYSSEFTKYLLEN